jgi:hypothetical protein
MKYSSEQLQKIEELAMLYMKPTEIAVIIEAPEVEFKADIQTADHPARTAYIKGKISQKLEVRKQMTLLARVGSPLALEQSERALLDMEDDE